MYRDADELLRARREADEAEAPPETPLVFRPFPLDALPKLSRRFVAEGARSIGCDPTYLALPLLAVLATAVGNSRTIRLKEGWGEPAVLWLAVVARSGTSKSPAFRLVLELLEAIEDALRTNWEAECERITKSEEGEKPPPEPHVYASDTTTEALGDILQSNRRGLLVARDELAGWLGSFNEYKSRKVSGDESRWLQLHDAGTLKVTRKNSKTVRVRRASVSIVGGIQPGILRARLTRDHLESGLAARVFFATPPETLQKWTEATLDPKVQNAMKDIVGELRDLSLPTDDYGTPAPIPIDLADDARALWSEFFNEHTEEQAMLGDDEGRACWPKLRGGAARLALVLHFTRWAEGGTTILPGRAGQEPTPVPAETLAAAIELSRWFGHEARRLYQSLGSCGLSLDLQEVVSWIQGRGGLVKVRDLQRGPRCCREPGRADDLLDQLEDLGLGRLEDISPEGAGRPTSVFRLDIAATQFGEEQ